MADTVTTVGLQVLAVADARLIFKPLVATVVGTYLIAVPFDWVPLDLTKKSLALSCQPLWALPLDGLLKEPN